ncbi:MAG: hypothetical protein MAG458_01747 [Nitrosopumilus sp.]|nr:hypothetical protein [Nitrosopumilus sp.]
MNTKIFLLGIVFGMISVGSMSAYADHSEVTIVPAQGSGSPGCEEVEYGCFIPGVATVDLGGKVIFLNDDSAAHTFSAGTPEGMTGEFDTSMVMAGQSYEWTADVAGEIDYFCMVHPWMVGVLIVQEVEAVEEEVHDEDTIIAPVLPENIIPKLTSLSDITLPATFTTGSKVSYSIPTARGGIITAPVSCTPLPDSLFPIGSTQVTCTATNQIGNTGMTSFMVTVNPIPTVTDQTVTVLAGKDNYTSIEPLFVTGSVGTITGDTVNIEVRDNSNKLVGIEQSTPKESGKYSAVLTSNELWTESGTYSLIANYGNVLALDSFEFELIDSPEPIVEQSAPTALSVSTENSAYLLGESILIDLELSGADSGEAILLEIRDSQNNQVLLQSLNTDGTGHSDIAYQLQPSQDPGLYSIIATSKADEWNYSDTATFTAIMPIPDVTIGEITPTIDDGTADGMIADSLQTGDMVSFNTPIVSNSTSDVLITVNVFDSQDTPLGLAYFKSKIVNDEFDIVLGLQIPQDAAPGMATVYINTYTDWTENGGVAINPEQVSFIEISPSSVTDLELSSDGVEPVPIVEPEPIVEPIPVTISNTISVQTELPSYGMGDTISISGVVSDYDGTNQVILRIISSDNNLIQVDQFTPNTDGTFLNNIPIGKLWTMSGEYTVMINHGSQYSETTFHFTGGN